MCRLYIRLQMDNIAPVDPAPGGPLSAPETDIIQQTCLTLSRPGMAASHIVGCDPHVVSLALRSDMRSR